MKIQNLTIENFLVLTEAKVKLSDRGLVLIQGQNKADSSANSNGAGKSSIADALCWAIYGVTARGESGDAVVNNKAGKNTRVEVEVVDNMTVYRIVRHRKHKTGKNALHVFMNDGYGETDLTKGTDKLTQEVVDKIIGASLDVFTGSIYAGQERMPDLPSMTDKMLKVLIEEAAGVNALEAAYKKARENAQGAKTDVTVAITNIEHTTNRISVLQSQLEQHAASEEAWTTRQAAQIAEQTKVVRDDLLPRAKMLAAEAPQSEVALVDDQIAATDAKIKAVVAEQEQLQRLASHMVRTQQQSYQAAQAQVSAEKTAATLKAQLAQVDHKIGCPCDSCGRPLTPAELTAAKSAAQTAYDKAVQDAADKKHVADTSERAARVAENVHDGYKLSMTDVSAEATLRASLQAKRNTLLAKDHEREVLVNKARDIVEQIKRLQAEVSPFVTPIATTMKSITEAKDLLANQKGELAVKQRTLDLETEVVRVFSPAGVRARVLDEVTPYLNAQTGKYLSILSDGNISAEWSTLTVNKAGEVKEKFAIDVASTISSKTFKGLSGGEKRKVRVATALALQDLVATRASKPIDLFIGDEIDDALDASGLERLMIILEDKAKERGTVMVISHNELRDEIPNVMMIERTQTGETKISETSA
jgi:DNA repair exonuclease SbcCD ATPase subunit